MALKTPKTLTKEAAPKSINDSRVATLVKPTYLTAVRPAGPESGFVE